MAEPLTRNLAVMLTDIKGFTDKTSRSSRSDIQQMLEDHKRVVLPELEARGGKLIKTIGDAFLMVFESPTDAVLAGVAAQEALAAHNADKGEDDRIEIRIAINSGEVNLLENDVYGEAVNITARIESVTQPGEVFFTEAVYLAMNKAEVPSSFVSLLKLKGIPEPVRVYKVKRETPVEGETREAPSAAAHLKRLLGLRSSAPLASSEKAAPALASAPRPKLSRRVVALLIDFAFCSMLVGMLFSKEPALRYRRTVHDKTVQTRVEAGAPADEEEDGEAPVEHKRGVAFPAFWLLYNTLFIGLWTATPGKRILKLCVVQSNGLRVEWKHAFTRALVSLISATAAFAGYLWAFWERDRRTWHDLLSETDVLDAPAKR